MVVTPLNPLHVPCFPLTTISKVGNTCKSVCLQAMCNTVTFFNLIFVIFQSEDDMQSNFSHLSEAEYKSRLSELAECSDDEEEDDHITPNESDKFVDRSKQ